MAKPPVFKPATIDELLAAVTPEERVGRYRRLVPSGPPPPALVVEVAAAVGSRAWRKDYGEPLPDGYLGFSAALELMALVEPDQRGLALLHGIAVAASSGLEARASNAHWPWSASLGHEATMGELDAAAGARAMERFHGRLVPFVNEETRRKYAHRYLFNRSVLDGAGIGFRHAMVGRGLALAVMVGFRRSEETLYALAHAFLHAPQDFAAAAGLEAWLGRRGSEIEGDNRNRAPGLPEEMAAPFATALVDSNDDALRDQTLTAWQAGLSLEAIAEALSLPLGRALGGEREAQALRALVFLDASRAAFSWLRGYDSVVQVLAAAACVREALGGTLPPPMPLPELAIDATRASPAALAAAIVGRDPLEEDAGWRTAAAAALLRQVAHSVDHGAEHRAALARLVAARATQEAE